MKGLICTRTRGEVARSICGFVLYRKSILPVKGNGDAFHIASQGRTFTNMYSYKVLVVQNNWSKVEL